MTFAQINAAIKEEMQLDPGLVSDAERMRYINDGMSAIGALHLLEKSTVVETMAQYPTQPTGMLRLRELFCEDVPLVALDGSADFTSTGTPAGYVTEGDDIRLFPIPSASVTLHWEYTYTPAACASITSTAVPDLPVGWDTLLIDYACYRAHRKNGNYLSASQYKKDYDSNLAMRIRERLSQINAGRHIMGRPQTVLSPDHYMPPADL